MLRSVICRYISKTVHHKSVLSHNRQGTPAPSQADVILCSFQHQAWCWDLGIGGASWVSCMTSSTSWPSWFQKQCCFPTEAVWGAGVYHCHIAVSLLCCDFIVSGCRSSKVFHTSPQLFWQPFLFPDAKTEN